MHPGSCQVVPGATMLRAGWSVLVLVLAASCNSSPGYGAYRECPPNASCRAPCERGEPAICSEDPCPEAGQRWVDLCEAGYRGHCQCQAVGADCSGVECDAAEY